MNADPHRNTPGEPVRCRSCGEWVIWTVTAAGKKMPCDRKPNERGTFYLFRHADRIEAVHVNSNDGRTGRALTRGDATYASHFATCPAAGEHRRPRR